MTPADWDAVREIYEQGIAGGNATFETSAPSWADWDRGHLIEPRPVATLGNVVAGWACLSPVSGRCVYRGVAEVSVYVHQDHRGRGVGGSLLAALVEGSERAGFWTLQAGVFPENVGSVRVLERAGFRLVGRRERLGRMGDVWRDVLLLERRSGIVGTGR